MTGRLDGVLVVVVAEGGGAERAGRRVEELRREGARVAVFVDEGEPAADTDALVELVVELDRQRPAGPSGRERESR